MRTKYPGACVLEYRNIIDLVIQVLIGWNKKKCKGTNGIFGVPLAYADCCEEQARYTLHSHISIWIENFNTVRNLLYHDNTIIQNQAREELQMYFHRIAQATLGDLYDFDSRLTTYPRTVHNISDVLIPPKDQTLRHMRHHVHCQDHHGVVGYSFENNYCCETGTDNPINVINSDSIVEKNTKVLMGHDSPIDTFNKHQNDILAYTFPYHMIEKDSMKPIDCQRLQYDSIDNNCFDEKIKQFNLRNPMLQLRFNIHDCYHRPSCFKKGPECRTELPQKHRPVATIQYEKNNTINWHLFMAQ